MMVPLPGFSGEEAATAAKKPCGDKTPGGFLAAIPIRKLSSSGSDLEKSWVLLSSWKKFLFTKITLFSDEAESLFLQSCIATPLFIDVTEYENNHLV
jgi:hypothetical protein